MMRQPGNSRLFCVCAFDCGLCGAGVGLNDPTGFSRKVLGEADPGPFVTSPLRVVCGFSHDAGIFCFTQGQPESWPPGP
jgi:hypothetical protein